VSVRALVAVGLVLGLGLAAPAPGDEIELGSIRIETPEGGLRVEVLEDDIWVTGRISMVGLRHEPSTTKLSPSAIRRLPA